MLPVQVSPWTITTNVRLYFPHPLYYYRYEVGMLMCDTQTIAGVYVERALCMYCMQCAVQLRGLLPDIVALTVVVVVVVVFTSTDRASTIPSNIRGCQSGTWSQRGTKVNRSHHGDNPLLRPTGIQIATKSYATLQAMAPTNSKTVHQTSFTPYREQPRSTRILRVLVGHPH